MIGQRIAHYEITGHLGAGGMGEVYRATDTKLNRDVALKILPEQFAADEQRMARFQREAEVLASLDHPGIGAIHGIEHAGDTHALVLQLIEGPTLADRIAQGQIPLEEALQIALQIAEALEAAHWKGVVHRDLKPANVKITPEGQVKVLDFGLAKAIEAEQTSSPDLTQSPTLTMAATQAGIILGTAGYMAPEQARGKAADRRADVWAWGAVLFEMLSGQRAFDGEDVSMVLAHVLSSEPEWGRLPAGVPVAIRDVLERCLRKKPAERIQAIGDARIALQEFLSDPTAASRTPAAAGGGGLSSRQKLLGGIALGTAVLAGTVAGWVLKTIPPPRPLHTEAALPGEKPLMRMFGPGAVLSPDGRLMVYSTGEFRNPNGQLYLRPTDQLTADPVSGTAGGYNPFFSPDGQWIGFVTTTDLKKVAVSGGAALTLAPAARSRGAAWGPDGTIVYVPNPNSPLERVSAAGGDTEPLTELEEGEVSHRWPQFLPGGRKILFTAYTSVEPENGVLYVLDLETGIRTLVHRGGTYGRYSLSGHLLFWRDSTVFGAEFDLNSLEMKALPAPVLQEVFGNPDGGAQFDLSDNGTLVFLPGDVGTVIRRMLSLAWVDSNGALTSASSVEAEFGEFLRLSPDRRRVVFERVGDNSDLWVLDLNRETSTRLTFDADSDVRPTWTPDSSTVYFASTRDGRPFQIYRKPADGSADAELVADGEYPQFPESISPDGKWLLYSVGHPETRLDLWILPLDESGEPRPFLVTEFVENMAVFSPDGRWVSYQSNESGEFEAYVRPFPGPGGKWQISVAGGQQSRWSDDGRTLFYNQGARLMRVGIDVSGDALVPGTPELLNQALNFAAQPPWEVSEDGRSVLVVTNLAERAALGPEDESIVVRLTFNWFEELRQRLAAGQ